MVYFLLTEIAIIKLKGNNMKKLELDDKEIEVILQLLYEGLYKINDTIINQLKEDTKRLDKYKNIIDLANQANKISLFIQKIEKHINDEFFSKSKEEVEKMMKDFEPLFGSDGNLKQQ